MSKKVKCFGKFVSLENGVDVHLGKKTQYYNFYWRIYFHSLKSHSIAITLELNV